MKMQRPGLWPDQAASDTSKICTYIFPTSLRTHSSKIRIRKRPYCFPVTDRFVTSLPSWYPVSLSRSTMGMNWMKRVFTTSRMKR